MRFDISKIEIADPNKVVLLINSADQFCEVCSYFKKHTLPEPYRWNFNSYMLGVYPYFSLTRRYVMDYYSVQTKCMLDNWPGHGLQVLNANDYNWKD